MSARQSLSTGLLFVPRRNRNHTPKPTTFAKPRSLKMSRTQGTWLPTKPRTTPSLKASSRTIQVAPITQPMDKERNPSRGQIRVAFYSKEVAQYPPQKHIRGSSKAMTNLCNSIHESQRRRGLSTCELHQCHCRSSLNARRSSRTRLNDDSHTATTSYGKRTGRNSLGICAHGSIDGRRTRKSVRP